MKAVLLPPYLRLLLKPAATSFSFPLQRPALSRVSSVVDYHASLFVKQCNRWSSTSPSVPLHVQQALHSRPLPQPSKEVSTLLLDAFHTKCLAGMLDEAILALGRAAVAGCSLQTEDWNRLLHCAVVQQKDADAAAAILVKMQEQGVAFNDDTDNLLIRARLLEGNWRGALEEATAATAAGRTLSQRTVLSLLDGLMQLNASSPALLLLKKLPTPLLSPRAFAVVMDGLVRKGSPAAYEAARLLLQQMRSRGIQPTLDCYNIFVLAWKLQAMAEAGGGSSGAGAGAGAGMMMAGEEGSEEQQEKDGRPVRRGSRHADSAGGSAPQWPRNGGGVGTGGSSSSSFSLTLETAMQGTAAVFADMQKDGVAPNEVMQNLCTDLLLFSYWQQQQQQQQQEQRRGNDLPKQQSSGGTAKKVSATTSAAAAAAAVPLSGSIAGGKSGSSSSSSSSSSVSSHVSALKSTLQACGLELSSYAYTKLMDALVEAGRYSDAAEVYRSMQGEGMHPDVHTFAVLLKAAVRGGKTVRQAPVVLQLMQRAGVSLNTVVVNTILDGYLREGRMDLAEELLRDAGRQRPAAVQPDAVTVSLLVQHYTSRAPSASPAAALELCLKHAGTLPMRRLQSNLDAVLRCCLEQLSAKAEQQQLLEGKDQERGGDAADAAAAATATSAAEGVGTHGQAELQHLLKKVLACKLLLRQGGRDSADMGAAAGAGDLVSSSSSRYSSLSLYERSAAELGFRVESLAEAGSLLGRDLQAKLLVKARQ